ncbi:hypothetical protein [Streptomyces sp. NBC_01264]|uniref:hypothetical protein n=1 Tax=Streptomyces sp. NBC_01264 TaxID=2903804 RepID=UPI0022557BF7|nr:hypothetical protein [Streptomyces sp. NBC_01264]MCX4781662.1 hypothetical protein [Streptomyces sp. NBC_01264]
MSASEMRQLVGKHSDCETRLDLHGTLNTLVEHPVYEFHPARLRLEGREKVERFYQEHFDNFFPLIESHTPVNECWDSYSACLEYDLRLKAPHDAQVYRITVVLTREGNLLRGERFHVGDELARLMAGASYGDFLHF